MRFLKRYFITGLPIWLPLVATVWVLAVLASTLGSPVPSFLSHERPFGVAIPALALVLVLVVIFSTGLFCAKGSGRAIVSRWDSLLGRSPLVRSIYKPGRQVSHTVLAPTGEAFREA